MAVSTAEFSAGSCVQLLTPEERAQAIEAFEDGDTDGTGKLDIDLLLETLVAAGHFVPEEHSGTILQLGDVDKNGDLDLNEFLELVGFLRSIAIAFQALGPQGGGRVERSALPLALRRFGWELDAEQHLALYRLCEAESSSLVEFSQVFKCILFLRLAQLLFEIADADKSGKLEFGELCELLPGIGVNKPEVEVRAVFESLDVDKSGELDFHEFLSLVLSVCTDQVRQLDATSDSHLLHRAPAVSGPRCECAGPMHVASSSSPTTTTTSLSSKQRAHAQALRAWQQLRQTTEHWRRHVNTASDALAALINTFTQMLYVWAPHWGALSHSVAVRRACFVKLLHRLRKHHHSLQVYVRELERQYAAMRDAALQLDAVFRICSGQASLVLRMHRADLVMRHLCLATIEQHLPLIDAERDDSPPSDDAIDHWLACNPFDDNNPTTAATRDTLVMQLNAWTASPLLDERAIEAALASAQVLLDIDDPDTDFDTSDYGFEAVDLGFASTPIDEDHQHTSDTLT